jgi:cell division septation protein DedD
MARFISYLLIFGLGIFLGSFYFPNGQWQNIDLPHFERKEASLTQPKYLQKFSLPDKDQSVEILSNKRQPNPSDLFAVQIGSFQNLDQARHVVAQLQERQIDAYVYMVETTRNKKHYRVYVGEYSDMNDAERKMKSLKSEFQDSFVQKI